MLNISKLIDSFKENNVDFFTGVPDSLLNGFCSELGKTVDRDHHIIAANEGNSVAIAAGYYFATQKIPLVYMQNSGIGNAMNPLLSLTDVNVYSVPMLLLIGWRGAPYSKDWAQHKTQGKITTDLMDDMDIPYKILTDDDSHVNQIIKKAADTAVKLKKPFALISSKGLLDGQKEKIIDDRPLLSREQAIEIILDKTPVDSIFAATTGRATRELYYLREKRNETHKRDFLNLGAMGHASSVAAGIAAIKKDRLIVCLDGDSAAIMHLGAMTTIGKMKLPNILHVVLNNGAHESVGGQPSAGSFVDFTSIARACGYKTLNGCVNNEAELKSAFERLQENQRLPSFIDIKIRKGIRDDLKPLKIEPSALINELISELNL